MPILPAVSLGIVAVIWLAVVIAVVTEGVGPGMWFWMEIFVLLGFPLLAYRSWLRMRAARGELGSPPPESRP